MVEDESLKGKWGKGDAAGADCGDQSQGQAAAPGKPEGCGGSGGQAEGALAEHADPYEAGTDADEVGGQGHGDQDRAKDGGDRGHGSTDAVPVQGSPDPGHRGGAGQRADEVGSRQLGPGEPEAADHRVDERRDSGRLARSREGDGNR